MADTKKTAQDLVLSLKSKPTPYNYDAEGFQRLQDVQALPQRKLFEAGAGLVGAEPGQDANETAGNIVSKLTSGLGTSTAADMLRTALQTGATVGLDPLVPGMGKLAQKAPLLGATVAKQNIARDIAKHILSTGDTSAGANIVRASADDLLNNLRTAKRATSLAMHEMGPGVTGVLTNTPTISPVMPGAVSGPRLPVNLGRTKIITGANEIVPQGIKPQNLLQASAPKSALDRALEKISSNAAKGQRQGTEVGATTRGMDLNKLVQDILRKQGTK